MMTLTHTGTESGSERWEEPDHSAVEYRAEGRTVLRFEAFTGGTLGLRRRIGARITAHHGQFEVAEIDSRYFVRADDQGYHVVPESSSGRDATHLEQHESKHGDAVAARIPDRVDALCRAQWRGARYRYVVTTGRLDPEMAAVPLQFPDGFPQHWPTPGSVEIDAERLIIPGVGFDHPGKAAITVRNRATTPQTITVHSASHYSFQVPAGDMVIPGGGSVRVPVRFLPPQVAGDVVGSLVIDTPSGSREVQLEGQLRMRSPYAPG
jgi:hypothetical protein